MAPLRREEMRHRISERFAQFTLPSSNFRPPGEPPETYTRFVSPRLTKSLEPGQRGEVANDLSSTREEPSHRSMDFVFRKESGKFILRSCEYLDGVYIFN